MEQLVKFINKKRENEKISINYQEYFINQILLRKTVRLVGELEHLNIDEEELLHWIMK